MTGTDASTRSSSHGALGSLSLLAGIVLLAFRGIEMTQSLPGMPRFWHNHEALWLGIGLAAVAFGAWLLAGLAADKDRSDWRPARPGRRFRNLILYTRAGCPLCEEAREILAHHQRWLPVIAEADIDHDPRLVEKFSTCVPVVSFDGKIRFRGKISPVLLRRLIEATPVAE